MGGGHGIGIGMPHCLIGGRWIGMQPGGHCPLFLEPFEPLEPILLIIWLGR